MDGGHPGAPDGGGGEAGLGFEASKACKVCKKAGGRELGVAFDSAGNCIEGLTFHPGWRLGHPKGSAGGTIPATAWKNYAQRVLLVSDGCTRSASEVGRRLSGARPQHPVVDHLSLVLPELAELREAEMAGDLVGLN